MILTDKTENNHINSHVIIGFNKNVTTIKNQLFEILYVVYSAYHQKANVYITSS